MQIGQTIRTFRKERGLTQQTLAQHLGVTTSAVSKWERDASCPDIDLLAPLARALHISLDTLLSFHAELTEEEIAAHVRQTDALFQTADCREGFLHAKSLIETYPNCLPLVWQLAVMLDAQRMTRDLPDTADYDDYLLDCYTRVLESDDETLRTNAADSLFHYYLRKEEYALAERCLSYFSVQNPHRKLKQAILESKTGQTEAALRAYEELLFSGCQMMTLTLQHLTALAAEAGDLPRMHLLTDKQRALAEIFDMGAYHAACCKLELATMERDRDAVLSIMETMLTSLESIAGFTASPLYAHMTFRAPQDDFLENLRRDLLACFSDPESYGFLSDDARYQALLHRT